MVESHRIEYKRELTDKHENGVVVFLSKQVTPQVEALLMVMTTELSRAEIQDKLKLKDKKNFNENYLSPALEWDLIEMTIS